MVVRLWWRLERCVWWCVGRSRLPATGDGIVQDGSARRGWGSAGTHWGYSFQRATRNLTPIQRQFRLTSERLLGACVYNTYLHYRVTSYK